MQLTEEQKKAINYRERSSFPYSHEITKPYGVLDFILAWCHSECRNDWRWELHSVSTDIRPGTYTFYFDSDLDFSAFLLKWS